MELVTGHAGSNHISAADMASMYRGILTDDDCVLASGDKLSCTMLDSNTAEIGTGDCFIQAHHCRVDVAEQLTVESGSAGYKRNDLVVIRYTLGDGNVQDVYLTVVKGTATVGTPSDPTLTEGDIDGGAVLAEFALWRIPIDGITVGTPVRVMPCVDTLQDQVDTLRESVSLNVIEMNETKGFGYVTGSAKTVQLQFPLPVYGMTNVSASGTASITVRGGTGASETHTVPASAMWNLTVDNYGSIVAFRYNLDTAFAGGNNVSVVVFLSGLTLTFS